MTQGQGGDIANPQPRLLGSGTENLAHLRQELEAGGSPPLSASAAIFRGSSVRGPASGPAPEPFDWLECFLKPRTTG